MSEQLTRTEDVAVTEAHDSPRRGRGGLIRGILANWGSLIVIAILWEIAGRMLGLSWLPPISEVAVELLGLLGSTTFLGYLGNSLLMFVIGWSLAVVVGMIVGTLMGLFARVNAALDVYVNALMVTPSLIFAPILFAIFGLSDITRISVVFLYGVFVIIINTSSAIRGVEQPLLDMAASYRSNGLTTVRRIILPASFPLTLAGLRLSVGRCVKGMINGEMFIALVGIGGVVSTASRSHEYGTVWAVSLLLMIIAITLNQVVTRAETRFTSWVG